MLFGKYLVSIKLSFNTLVPGFTGKASHLSIFILIFLLFLSFSLNFSKDHSWKPPDKITSSWGPL